MDQQGPTPPFGKLARGAGADLPLTVCHSQAGYYLGTLDAEGLPFSRESAEYWRKPATAHEALRSGQWTQRLFP